MLALHFTLMHIAWRLLLDGNSIFRAASRFTEVVKIDRDFLMGDYC